MSLFTVSLMNEQDEDLRFTGLSVETALLLVQVATFMAPGSRGHALMYREEDTE